MGISPDGQLLSKSDAAVSLAECLGIRGIGELGFRIDNPHGLNETSFEARADFEAQLLGLEPKCVDPLELQLIDAQGLANIHDDSDPLWEWQPERFPVTVKVIYRHAFKAYPEADLVTRSNGRSSWVETMPGRATGNEAHTIVMAVKSFGHYDGTR